MINNKDQLSEKILKIIKDIQDDYSLDWVNLTSIGPLLTIAGIDFKEYGYARLRPFLNVFDDILELKEIVEDDKPAVWYVRPTTISNSSIAEKQNEEKCDFVSNLEAPEILNGKIQWVKYDDEYRFKGVIETEEHGTFFFTGDSWLNKSLSVEDVCDNADVEFELKKPNQNNIVYPKRIRFKGESIAANYQSDFRLNHSHGDFRKFVYLKLSVLKGAFSRVLEDFDVCGDAFVGKMLDVITSTYANLSDDDFEFDLNNETLTFFSGFEKNGGKIYLYCTKNFDPDKSEWYCDRIMCNGKFVGSVFNVINADWYDILANLKEIIRDFPKNTEVKTVIEKIEQRCVIDDSLIWIDEGNISDEDNAELLFAPTGYFIDENKELYLSCSYRRGIKGDGWYYDYITYENAPIEIYDKKDWFGMWADFEWEDVYFCIANQTLEEKWSFGNRNDYSILRNYLNYIFAHQWRDNAVVFSKDLKYAAFNTGLPDRHTYKYIYAFCEKIESDTVRHPLIYSPQYRLKSFVLSDRGGDGKTLKTNIHPLPPPPQFFEARSATVWELDFNDNNQPTMPGFDDTHILIQRCDRLPLDFYRRAAYSSETFKNILNSETSDFQKYNEIRDFLRPVYDNNDKTDAEVTQIYQELYDGLERVISKAVRKLSWNWRAVVPCYNPEREEPCFLLPVSFCDTNRPDRAMIASMQEVDGEFQYSIHTVLPLEWAYLDARLVCRPESEWLAADSIT